MLGRGSLRVGYNGVAGGLHPVRHHVACQDLIANFSLPLIEEHLGPLRAHDSGGGGGGPSSPPHRIEAADAAPYLANSVWIAKTGSVANVMSQDDRLFGWRHPFDEAPLNHLRYMSRQRHTDAALSAAPSTIASTPSAPAAAPSTLCVARDAMVLHPQYNGAGESLEPLLHEGESSHQSQHLNVKVLILNIRSLATIQHSLTRLMRH